NRLLLLILIFVSGMVNAQRVMENLGRGVVALQYEKNKVFISWRVLADDPVDVAFNVYRESDRGKKIKLNAAPLRNETHFIDSLVDLSQSNKWFIANVINGKELRSNTAVVIAAKHP